MVLLCGHSERPKTGFGYKMMNFVHTRKDVGNLNPKATFLLRLVQMLSHKPTSSFLKLRNDAPLAFSRLNGMKYVDCVRRPCIVAEAGK